MEQTRWRNKYPAGNSLYAQWTGEGYDDGHPHERDDNGWCKNCMAPPGCSHTRLVPKEGD